MYCDTLRYTNPRQLDDVRKLPSVHVKLRIENVKLRFENVKKLPTKKVFKKDLKKVLNRVH